MGSVQKVTFRDHPKLPKLYILDPQPSPMPLSGAGVVCGTGPTARGSHGKELELELRLQGVCVAE